MVCKGDRGDGVNAIAAPICACADGNFNYYIFLFKKLKVNSMT